MTSNRRSLILLLYAINRISNCFPIETSSDKIVSRCFFSRTTMTTTSTATTLLLLTTYTHYN